MCVNLTKRAQFSEQQVQQLLESFYAKYLVMELSKSLALSGKGVTVTFAMRWLRKSIRVYAFWARRGVWQRNG